MAYVQNRLATGKPFTATPRTFLSPRLGRVPATLREWKHRKRFRDELRRILRTAPHMIPDIGMKPDEALYEIDKPFWRP